MKLHPTDRKLTFRVGFPSPCGEEVMKYSLDRIDNNGSYWFPSPCGEEVMKSSDSKSLSN